MLPLAKAPIATLPHQSPISSFLALRFLFATSESDHPNSRLTYSRHTEIPSLPVCLDPAVRSATLPIVSHPGDSLRGFAAASGNSPTWLERARSRSHQRSRRYRHLFHYILCADRCSRFRPLKPDLCYRFTRPSGVYFSDICRR